MRKITDYISKEIVTIADAEIRGIVTNAYVTDKLSRVKGFKVSCEEQEDARCLPLYRIVGEGDALTASNKNALQVNSYKECPLGSKIFDSTGRSLGVLRDVVFDETRGEIISLLTNEETFSPTLVIAASKSAVVLRAAMHEGKRFAKPGAKSHHTHKRGDASVLSTDTLYKETSRPFAEKDQESQEEMRISLAPIVEANTENTELSEETKKTFMLGEYEFLLGRKVLKEVSSNGEIVAEKGEIVRAETIKNAREKGKLVELTVNSKKE